MSGRVVDSWFSETQARANDHQSRLLHPQVSLLVFGKLKHKWFPHPLEKESHSTHKASSRAKRRDEDTTYVHQRKDAMDAHTHAHAPAATVRNLNTEEHVRFAQRKNK